MKGLILKDLYMMKKYCRTYLLVAIIFIAVPFVSRENLFFIFYPCLLCGMIPANLLAYDERSKWIEYSCTLPYTRGQIVSCKYIVGLMVQICLLIVIGISQIVRMNINDTFLINEFGVLMMMLLIISMIASSISLPFMFKLGVEKGRIAYYVMVGAVCAGCTIASNFFKDGLQNQIQLRNVLPVLSIICVVIYLFSWYLSVVFFNKREL